jgi:hypothetical protein
MTLTYCPACGFSLQPFDAVTYGNVRIDHSSAITFDGRGVDLAHTQFKIVEALIRARGRYLTRGMLVDILGRDIYDKAICQYVKRARLAFRALDKSFDQIESIRGFEAYRWRFRAARSSSVACFPLQSYPTLMNRVRRPDGGAALD